MLKKNSLLLPLTLLLNIASINAAQTGPRLSNYRFKSASVLPIYTYKKTKYAILAREAWGKPLNKGGSRGTYDDFGGSRDKGERHPVITAAREFFEEAILSISIGLNLAEVTKYIDIAKTDNTQAIVAYAHNVAYITNFNPYALTLLRNFYRARRETNDVHSKEKNSIAVVKWDVLKKTIQQNPHDTGVSVEALELNSKTRRFEKKLIPLRTYFVKKLRPFFTEKPYKEGLDKKIRFYDGYNKRAFNKLQRL